jgi:energy-converting hydrogenase Eha subunit A
VDRGAHIVSEGPSWKYRRRAIFSTLVFGAVVIVWVIASGDDRSVLDTVVLSVAGLMGAALSVYTGASAYEDVRLHRKESNPDG